jgi:hypothetical protein
VGTAGFEKNRMSPQSSYEQVFLQRLGALERDALAAARCAYVGSAIHYITNQQPALIPILGRDAGFWNTVLGAMRTSAIVALGRIYDSRGDVLSARRLLDHVLKYPGIFSRAALAARKTVEFAADAFEPKEADFQPLRDALDEHTKIYETTVGPIRHNVYAHAGDISTAEIYELHANVARTDFEKLSIFPLDLYNTLFRLYVDGERPVLLTIESDLATLVASPAGNRAVLTEPKYAIKDTLQFLEHLAGVPIAQLQLTE